MTPTLRTLAARALVALAVLCGALAAGPALAEIFKCSAKGGMPLYQNFPCHVDSLGSLPSQSTVNGTPAAAPAAAPTPDRANARSAEHGAAMPAPLVKPTAASGPQIGMTQDQVKAMLGDPDEMLEDEPRSGRVFIWRYGNREVVMFDVKRHVISVQPYSVYSAPR